MNKRCYRFFATGPRKKCLLDSELYIDDSNEIFVGCKLYAAVTNRRLTNGALLEVKAFDEILVQLYDEELEITLSLPIDELKHCRYGYALTYCASQGRSLSEVRLHDTGHPMFTKVHLSMGLARATQASKVDIS